MSTDTFVSQPELLCLPTLLLVDENYCLSADAIVCDSRSELLYLPTLLFVIHALNYCVSTNTILRIEVFLFCVKIDVTSVMEVSLELLSACA